MAAGLRSMAKFASDAARGAQEQTRAMEQLNIKSAAFIKLPMDQQFSTIIDKLGEVENVTLRNALGQEALGKGYSQLAGLVSEGAEQFAKATRDAEAWGLAINRVDAAKIEMANDAMTRARDAARGLFTTIALTVSPVIKAMGDLFADSAAEAGGFKKQAGQAAEVVITGIGYAANVVQGLRFAYVGVKLVIAEVIDAAVQGFAALARVVAESRIVQWAQYMPGPLGVAAKAFGDFSSSASGQLGLMAESTRATADSIKAELEAIALEGLPKDKIIAKVREIRELMQKEAEEIAKRRQQMMLGSGEDVAQDKAVEKKEPKDTWRDKLAQQIERLREENMTELQLLDEKLREKNLLLQSALESELITEEAAAAQSALIQAKYEEAKTKITDAETKRRFGISNLYRKLDLSSAGAFFGAMGTMMDSSSRTAFNIGKAAAISQTIIDTYRAAQGAFASLAGIPFIGPVLGAAAAAAAIISGMARVKSIKSQQFGGGAAATPVFSASPSTGIPTSPISPLQSTAPPQVAAQVREEREMNVTILGRSSDKVSYAEMVEDLIPVLEQAVANGATRLNVGFAS
jgi:hypothetical protein